MINTVLELDYALSPGWLEPWVKGVLDGKAIGRRCKTCNKISFTPLRRCACGKTQGSWATLPGLATLIHKTEGADGVFGLVQFDDAYTKTVVKLVDWDDFATRGQLIAPETQTPTLLLTPFTVRRT